MSAVLMLLFPVITLFGVFFAMHFRGTGARSLYILYGFLYAVAIGVAYGVVRYLLLEKELQIGGDLFLSILFSLCIVGFLGEVGKILLLRYYAIPFLEFENCADGVSWGAALGAGVALGQVGITYILTPYADVMEFRLFSEMIVHIECGILLGYFTGSVVENDNSYWGLWISIVLAVLAHAAFDFSFTMGAMPVLGFLAVIFTFSVIFMLVRAVATDQRFHERYNKRFRQIGRH